MGDLSRFQLRGLLRPSGQHFQHREIGLTAGLVQTQADFAVDLSDGYSDDVDKVLPEAGALETARSYREKKAKPLYKIALEKVKDDAASLKELQKEMTSYGL